VGKSNEIIPNGHLNADGAEYTSIPLKEKNMTSVNILTKSPDLMKDSGGDLHANNMGGDELAFSMLNRNLPIYMICPHCRRSRNKKDTANVKFASGISQLKRIFMV
jgi:protein SMG8